MTKKFNCLNCGKEHKIKASTTNKYCDNKCQGEWKWKNVTVPRILAGECTHNSSTALKKFLIETRGCKCELCDTTDTWNGKPLVLQLDHVDGDSDNNYPSNLRLLCPNCHSQTDTFGSKGKGNRYKKDTKRNDYLRSYKSPGA